MFVRLAAAAITGMVPWAASAQSGAAPDWLSGEWEQVATEPNAGGWTIERWSRPRGGVMLGTSLSGRRRDDSGSVGPVDQAGPFEFLRIAPGQDGRLTYFAQPGGSPATAFPMARSGRYEIVFENAAHDYPQRIAYRWNASAIGGETLTATISLIDGSRAMSWTYRRPQPQR